MRSLTFYKYTTAILLIINLALIAFFFVRPKEPHGRAFMQRASEILHLNDQQKSTFKEFAIQHGEAIRSINEKQKALLVPYFQELVDGSTANNKLEVLNQFKSLEQEKLEITYSHFEDIKELLLPEQKTGYQEFINRALQKVVMPGKKDRQGPKER